jgi:hypothetical protein
VSLSPRAIRMALARLAAALAALAALVGRAEAAYGQSATPAERVNSTRLPLSTRDGKIVDNEGQAVHLACVNWYHMHMENYVVGGLHEQRYQDIVRHIGDLGFNCVRIPFSVEVVLENPLVPELALRANPSLQGLRALEIYDLIVGELLANDILVVQNNHNSKAGWCCSVTSKEGLWNTDEYSTDQWVDAMGLMAARYASRKNVVAFDLRNEIHDVGDTVITWGTSGNKDTDWKVASELAASKVQAAAPDLLIIVSGLCFGAELRPLHANPPTLAVGNKLVWTTHTYGETTWWTIIAEMTTLQWAVTYVLAVLMIVFGSLGLVVVAFPTKQRAEMASAGPRAVILSLSSWALGLGLVFVFCGVLWRYALTQAGCRAMERDALITTYVSASLALFAATLLALTKAGKIASSASSAESGIVVAKEDDPEALLETSATRARCCLPGCRWLNLGIVSFVLLVCGAPLLILARDAQRYDLLAYDLDIKWGTQGSKAPIWVGEFGAPSVEKNLWWPHLMQYIRNNKLHWAYWALDGSRWYAGSNATNGYWGYEGYGLLLPDYANIRNPPLLADLQAIQGGFD